MEREYFTFYKNYFEAFQCLDPEDRLQAYDALAEYALNGREIEVSGAAKAMLQLIKPQIDANYKRFLNGKSGGRKKTETDDVPYENIIEYLNAKTGKHFSAKSEATKKHISGRWHEGHGLEDFKHVIDVKCAEWMGNAKMEQYIRPSTLFAPNNFENYLNQRPVRSKVLNFEQRDTNFNDLEAALDRQFAGV